jgi:hypothetical protein
MQMLATLILSQKLTITHAFSLTDATTPSHATSIQTQHATTELAPTPGVTMLPHATTTPTQHAMTVLAFLSSTAPASAAVTSSSTHATTATTQTVFLKLTLSPSHSLEASNRGSFQTGSHQSRYKHSVLKAKTQPMAALEA